MLSLESLLNSIGDFLLKYLTTFYHSVLRPRLFIVNLLNKKQEYLKPHFYLLINGLFAFAFFQIANSGLFAWANIKKYTQAISTYSSLGPFEILKLVAPFCIVIYALIYFTISLLGIKKPWSKFFLHTTIVWFASWQVIKCLAILLLLVLGMLFNNENGYFGKNLPVADFLGNNIEVLGIVFAVVLLSLPFRALFVQFYEFHKWLLFRFTIITLLALYTFTNSDKIFLFLDDVSLQIGAKQYPKPKRPEILNAIANQKEIDIVERAFKKDSVFISMDILIYNNTVNTYYIARDNHIIINSEILPEKVCIDSEQSPLYFSINKWHSDESTPVLFIEPGAKQIISLSTVVHVKKWLDFKSKVTCSHQSLEISLLQFKDPDETNAKKSYLYDIKILIR